MPIIPLYVKTMSGLASYPALMPNMVIVRDTVTSTQIGTACLVHSRHFSDDPMHVHLFHLTLDKKVKILGGAYINGSNIYVKTQRW